MGKRPIVPRNPNAPTVSAFAVYNNETAVGKTKRGRVESSTSIQDPTFSYAPYNAELEGTTDSKGSGTSTSFMKHFSNKAAFSFKRKSMKRKKKDRKLPDQPATHWRPSCIPNEAYGKSPMLNFASERSPLPFTGASSKVENGQLDPKSKLNAKAKKPLFKEDRSIELSTSQSLNEGAEDDDKTKSANGIPAKEKLYNIFVVKYRPKYRIQFTNTDISVEAECHPKLSSEGMAIDLVIQSGISRPPKKKVRVSNLEVFAATAPGESKTLEQDDEQMQLHASAHNPPTVEKKKKLKSPNKSTLSSSSFTTISKKASSIPKMPQPAGDCEKDGHALFEWLVHPFSTKKFFNTIWETKPLLIRRHIPHYADGLFSTDDLNRILVECNVRFSVNLDVTTYQNGVRETLNEEGRAFAPVVWDYYKNGCSVRIKNPQAFSKPVWRLCATLQEYFKSMVGANIYLTPAGNQGFAPHYDDIEAFVLQLEGKKQWSLYNPRNKQETLPRFSSENFSPDEIGSEIFSTTLEPGDLLYFPRGFIHQARSLPDSHSLHITISTYQRNTWGDLMKELVSNGLNKAIAEDVEFRKGLPLDYLTYLGVQNCDKDAPRRGEMLSKVSHYLRKLADHIDVDAAVDQKAVEFLHDALPPVLNEDELARSINGANVRMVSPGCPGSWLCDVDASTRIRVLRKNALRLFAANQVTDANDNLGTRVYHSVQNPRTYHQEEKKFFEMEPDCAPAVEYLIHSYPNYVTVGSLPLKSDDEKVILASSLFEKGLIMTEAKTKMMNRNQLL